MCIRKGSAATFANKWPDVKDAGAVSKFVGSYKYAFDFSEDEVKNNKLKYRFVGASCREDFGICEPEYKGIPGDSDLPTNGKGMCCGTAQPQSSSLPDDWSG